MKSWIKGTGLTKIKVRQITSKDDATAQRAFNEALSEPNAYWTLRECLEAVVGQYREKLEANGLPGDEARPVVVFEDGSWTYEPPRGAPKNTKRKCLASAYLQSQFEHDSEEWYVAEAIHYAWQMEVAESEDKRIEAAMCLARTVERTWWKFGHEAAALEGYASFDRRDRGRKNGTERSQELSLRRRKAIVAKVRDLYPDFRNLKRFDSTAAERIERLKLEELRLRDGTYLGSEAIRDHIREAKRAGDL